MVNRSAPPGPVVPTLIYADVAEAIDWLCAAFGFTERLRTAPEPDGTIHHAQLAVGAGAVILTGPSGYEAQRRNAFIETLYVSVADVDSHFARSKQFGARILNPPVNCEFGERQYNVEDLGGNRWTFSQSVSDVNPDGWGAKVAEIQSRLALLPRPRLCYMEIPAAAVSQSIAFYENVFGWNIRGRESNHPSFDDATGNVSGTWVTGRDAAREPGLLLYIWVDGIDSTLAQVAVHGGEIVEAPHADSPGSSCWIATFRDPAGNLMGLYQEGPR